MDGKKGKMGFKTKSGHFLGKSGTLQTNHAKLRMKMANFVAKDLVLWFDDEEEGGDTWGSKMDLSKYKDLIQFV